MRPALSRQLQSAKVFMLRPIPLHVFCAAALSQKPVRYCSMSQGNAAKTLSHWHSRLYRQKYSGQSLPGFPTSFFTASKFGFFYNPGKKRFQVSSSLLSSHQQIHRFIVQPDHCADRLLFLKELSRKTETDPLRQSRNGYSVYFFGQLLYASGPDRYPTVQVSLADRTVFQVDQAASAHQGILCDFAKCRQNSNLDCHFNICSYRHHEETTQAGYESLHNSTDFKRQPFRKSPTIASTYRNQLQNHKH